MDVPVLADQQRLVRLLLFDVFIQNLSNLKHYDVPDYGPDWLAGIIANQNLDLTTKTREKK